MKSILNVLVVLLALYGAYMLYENYIKPPPPPPPPPAVAPAPRPKRRLVRVVCPTCNGEEKLTYANRRGENQMYPCPICNCGPCSGKTDGKPGKGHRCVYLPPLQVADETQPYDICPDCKGMGFTEKRETTRDVVGYKVSAVRCLRCDPPLSGAVKAKKKPLPGATPGVQPPEFTR